MLLILCDQTKKKKNRAKSCSTSGLKIKAKTLYRVCIKIVIFTSSIYVGSILELHCVCCIIFTFYNHCLCGFPPPPNFNFLRWCFNLCLGEIVSLAFLVFLYCLLTKDVDVFCDNRTTYNLNDGCDFEIVNEAFKVHLLPSRVLPH